MIIAEMRKCGGAFTDKIGVQDRLRSTEEKANDASTIGDCSMPSPPDPACFGDDEALAEQKSRQFWVNSSQQSHWRPMLCLFPTLSEMHMPFLWSDSELNLLGGSDLLRQSRCRRQAIAMLHEVAVAVMHRNGCHWLPSIDSLQWSLAVCCSRWHESSNGTLRAIIPMVRNDLR